MASFMAFEINLPGKAFIANVTFKLLRAGFAAQSHEDGWTLMQFGMV